MYNNYNYSHNYLNNVLVNLLSCRLPSQLFLSNELVVICSIKRACWVYLPSEIKNKQMIKMYANNQVD